MARARKAAAPDEAATVLPLAEGAPEEKRAVTSYADAERLFNLGQLSADEIAELRASGLLVGGGP